MSEDMGRIRGSLTDKSGSSSTTTAQIAAANPYREYFFFQNLDAAIVQYVNFGAAATATNSYKVAAGATLEFKAPQYVPTDAINVIAASGTPAYTAKEG